ncbi:MAG TPA: YihY/virulence factor BrkB family protein [Gemmata sp.]|nr:YihY/virulence factor BrkB family protein [Gemmata sp.]
MKLRDVGSLAKDAGKKFIDDKGPRLGAALAFYTALSLSPLLLAVVAIAGLAFGEEAARGEIVGQLRDTAGEEGATVVEKLIANSAASSGKGLAAVVAFAVLFFGASGVFVELQAALNTVWQVPGRKTEGGVWAIVRQRLLSFSLVCGVAFLLLASLVVSAVLSAVNDRIAAWLPGMGVLAQVLNFLLTFGLLTLLFAMIFQWLPETDLAWSDVWVGAAVTAALFSVGKYLIGLYLGHAAVGSAYGAAGAFVVLLAWIYWSSQILLFGAELTFVYAQRFGRGIQNAPAAQPGTPRLEPAG